MKFQVVKYVLFNYCISEILETSVCALLKKGELNLIKSRF